MLNEPKTDPLLPFLVVEDVRTYRIKGGKKRMRLRTAIRDYCEERYREKDRDRWNKDKNEWIKQLRRKEERFHCGYLWGSYRSILIPRYVRFVEHLTRCKH